MAPAYWLPPVVWMALILIVSSDLGSAEHTSRFLVPLLRALWPAASPAQLDALHALLRKGAHFAEYAVLAALWFRAFARGRSLAPGPSAWAAAAASAGWAVVDETRQALTATRTASVADVGIDAAGAVAAALVAALGWSRAAEKTTGGLLWAAAGGGAIAIVLNALAGVPSGALWLTVPAAAVALGVRRRWRRRP